MKTVNLSEAKNQLSKYVDQVRHGERVRILIHGHPVADLVPVSSQTVADADWTDAELVDLERRGIIRRGHGRWPAELDKPGPRVGGNRAVELLIEERRGSR